MIRKAAFVIRLAAQDVKGNAWVHLAAGAIITAAFLTLGLFILVAANLRALARHWEDKVQVCVYLDDGLDDPGRAAMGTWLKGLDGIRDVQYTGKDKAMEDFKTMLGADSELLQGLDGNPLPASFTLTLSPGSRGLESVKKLSALISKRPGVEEVDYGGKLLEGFAAVSRIAQAAVMLIGGLILVAVVFIISNTVRLTMYSRSDEIGIMRLVGASNLIIRLPFIIEGLVQGGMAAALGAAVLFLIYRLGVSGLTWPGVLSGFTPVFLSSAALWGLIAGGAALGAAGSLSKVRDFMRA